MAFVRSSGNPSKQVKKVVWANGRARARTAASTCHAEGRGFESLHPLSRKRPNDQSSSSRKSTLQAAWELRADRGSPGRTGWPRRGHTSASSPAQRLPSVRPARTSTAPAPTPPAVRSRGAATSLTRWARPRRCGGYATELGATARLPVHGLSAFVRGRCRCDARVRRRRGRPPPRRTRARTRRRGCRGGRWLVPLSPRTRSSGAPRPMGLLVPAHLRER